MNQIVKRKTKKIFSIIIAYAMFFSAINLIIPSNTSDISDLQTHEGLQQCSIDLNEESIPASLSSIQNVTGKNNSELNDDSAAVSLSDGDKVYPGGMPFGIKLYTDGLLVVGFADVDSESGSKSPALDAGLQINDVITKINGKKIKSSEDFVLEIQNSSAPVEMTYLRNGSENTITVQPSLSKTDGKYKTGMWLRDSTAGIGTVTFIVPKTREFAGLGHGVCDNETGELMPIMRGVSGKVKISGVNKGIPGTPGELKGYFTEENSGVILKNMASGVFGIFNEIPMDEIPDESISIGTKKTVHTGDAYIWCTLDGNGPQKYSIEIASLGSSEHSSNFEIKITDDNLIDKTGGIVQGMSGSPIIQDGNLVGAVTHVMINDPERGYGIFIENMLKLAD